MLLIAYVAILVVVPVALGLLVAINGVPRTRLCPLCAGETLRVQSYPHALLSRLIPGSEIHTRWCPACEWTGTARVPVRVQAAVRRERLTPRSRPVHGRSQGLEVRRIEMDDGAWRVRLECWEHADAWHGRLLFGGPAGAWVDGRRLLTGRSPVDVLSQVMSLPEEALVGWIRKATR